MTVRAYLTPAGNGTHDIEAAGLRLERERHAINRMCAVLHARGLTGDLYGMSEANGEPLLRFTADIAAMASKATTEDEKGIRRVPWKPGQLDALRKRVLEVGIAPQDARQAHLTYPDYRKRQRGRFKPRFWTSGLNALPPRPKQEKDESQ